MECFIAGCVGKGVYFIGSLLNELAGQEKFGYYCRLHESSIARENAGVHKDAREAGMTVIDFIDRRKPR